MFANEQALIIRIVVDNEDFPDSNVRFLLRPKLLITESIKRAEVKHEGSVLTLEYD